MIDNYKKQLQILYSFEIHDEIRPSYFFAELAAYWKNHPVIRKSVIYKGLKYQRMVRGKLRDEIKADLMDWYDRMVLNYSDLTAAQKERINKNEQLYSFDAFNHPIAAIKTIRMRDYYDYKQKYNIVKKLVIIYLR